MLNGFAGFAGSHCQQIYLFVFQILLGLQRFDRVFSSLFREVLGPDVRGRTLSGCVKVN